MACFGRTKQVIYPLNDQAKARFEQFYVSSGSEHSGAEAEDDVVSPSFSDLQFGFLQNDVEDDSTENESNLEQVKPMYDDSTVKIINPMANNNGADSFRDLLLAHVSKAAEIFADLKSKKAILRRNVMSFLRNLGYNAGICKTDWNSSGGLTAGSYEFIDVEKFDKLTNQITRYFINLDFAAEFEIARPSHHYERLLKFLPEIFVGKTDDLKHTLKVMSDAAKRSVKSRNLHMPPWRKHRYVQNKYFGPYRRTLNLMPSNSTDFMETVKERFAVKCRSVGFNAINGGLFFPGANSTCTR